MKALRIFTPVLFLGCLSISPLLADGDGSEGEIEIGFWDASVDGSPDIASEYESNDGGLELLLDMKNRGDASAVDLAVEARDDNDYRVLLGFDVNRAVRSNTAVTGLLHRLHHESLAHFTAATNHGRVSRHTDLDPTAVYGIDYTLLDHWTEFQPRGASHLTFGVGYRRQERDGTRQVTTVSHCDACHVVSQGRPVDETTSDATLEARLAWDQAQVGISFTGRSYDNNPRNISLLFDDALHPELRRPLFDNRLQFDSAEGPQPVDLDPDMDKTILRIDGTYQTDGGLVITAEGVASSTENQYTRLEADYTGYLVTAAQRINDDWSFRWRGRGYQIDNDDVFVDAVERLGVAGPQAGRTYREIYGFNPDYLRQSALNRDVIESDLQFTRRLGKKQGRLRLFWNYETIDRDTFEVAPGDTETTTNLLGASWWARPAKGWKTNLLVQHGERDQPFGNVNGAYSTLTSPAVPNPFDPNGAQYYEFHAARLADVSASPAQWDELKLRASHAGAKTVFSGTYRWWDGDNTEGDLADWSRTVQAATLTLWSAPDPEWEWQLAYAYNQTERGSPASIPLFDG